MMCCWILIAFSFAPRVALFFMWLLTDRISRAFGGALLPLIGFFLLPWTTLTYTLVSQNGLNIIEIVFLVIAVSADLGIWGGGAKKRQSQ
jgi:hypothetical protein